MLLAVLMLGIDLIMLWPSNGGCRNNYLAIVLPDKDYLFRVGDTTDTNPNLLGDSPTLRLLNS